MLTMRMAPNPVSGAEALAMLFFVPLSIFGGWQLARVAERKLCWLPGRGQWRALKVPNHIPQAAVADLAAGAAVQVAMGRTTLHPSGRPMLDPDSPVKVLPARLAGTPVDPQLELSCYTPGAQVVLPAPMTGQEHRGWQVFTDFLLPPDVPAPLTVAEIATSDDVADALDLFAFRMRPQPKLDSVIYSVWQRYYPACAATPAAPQCVQLMEAMAPAAQDAIQKFG